MYKIKITGVDHGEKKCADTPHAIPTTKIAVGKEKRSSPEILAKNKNIIKALSVPNTKWTHVVIYIPP